jgi:hypothetical protein
MIIHPALNQHCLKKALHIIVYLVGCVNRKWVENDGFRALARFAILCYNWYNSKVRIEMQGTMAVQRGINVFVFNGATEGICSSMLPG